MTLVAQRPPARAAGPYRFPDVHRSQAAGGQIVCADQPGRPLAAVSVILPGGAGVESIESAGLSQLTGRALSEGTTARDAEAFSLAVEALGMNVGVSTSWDTVTLSVGGPATRVAEAAQLLAEAFFSPALDSDDLIRLRTERVESQQLRWSRPGTAAGAAFRRALHGADTRYGWLESGDPASNAALEPEQVRWLHARWLETAATLVVSGDLSLLDLDTLATTLLGTQAGRNLPALTKLRPLETDRSVTLIDRPGAAQSSIVFGHRGPARWTPDFGALTTTAAVLGGSFNSRLNTQLRQVKGYSYGASAGFDMHRYTGELRGHTEVRTDATAPAVCDAVAEFLTLHTDGVTEHEAREALDYQIGAFATTLETPGAISRALATIVVNDLPDDYYSTLRTQLTNLGKQDLDRMAREHFDPSRLSVVVEGDLATFADELAEADLGPTTVLRADELMS